MKEASRSAQRFVCVQFHTAEEVACRRIRAHFPSAMSMNVVLAPNPRVLAWGRALVEILKCLGEAHYSLALFLAYSATEERGKKRPSADELAIAHEIPGVVRVDVLDPDHPITRGRLPINLFLGEVSRWGSVGVWGTFPQDLDKEWWSGDVLGRSHDLFPWVTHNHSVHLEVAPPSVAERAALRVLTLDSEAGALPREVALSPSDFAETPLGVLVHQERTWVFYTRENSMEHP